LRRLTPIKNNVRLLAAETAMVKRIDCKCY
jgi:hypothetical protein